VWSCGDAAGGDTTGTGDTAGAYGTVEGFFGCGKTWTAELAASFSSGD
jgi:hypothetical protein